MLSGSDPAEANMSAPRTLPALKVCSEFGRRTSCIDLQRYEWFQLSSPHSQDLCVQVVAVNFEENPTFGPLPEKYIRKITNILALDLPLELVGSVSAA